MSADAYILQGGNGGHVVNSGEGAVAGSFRWVQCLTDTVLAGVTNGLLSNAGDLVGVTLPAGVGFGGLTSSIEVTSGTVIAYK